MISIVAIKKLSFSIRVIFIILVGVILFLLANILRTSNFSPDSWSYFELSQYIFSDDFYGFNTYRSYFSTVKSASFPFLYPVSIAILNSFIEPQPYNSVFLNVLIVLTTLILFLEIASYYKLPAWYQLCFSISLISTSQYLDEVLSGRSIPLAIMLYTLSAYFLLLKRNHSLSGFFLGVSCLSRFDSLPVLLIFSFLTLISFNNLQKLLRFMFFAFLGILPWVVYSLIYFDSVWVSDNSWVTLSAYKAFVLDYPAKPTISIYDQPYTWAMRVLSNIPYLIKPLIEVYKSNPLFLFFLFLYVIKVVKSINNFHKIQTWILVFSLISSLSLTPYILTGYFDARYFIPWISFTTFLFSLELFKPHEAKKSKLFFILTLVIMILNMYNGYHYLKLSLVNKSNNLDIEQQSNFIIENISSCHKKMPNVTLLFPPTYSGLGFKYGAITMNQTAISPSNIDITNLNDNKSYFDFISPFKIVNEKLTCD